MEEFMSRFLVGLALTLSFAPGIAAQTTKASTDQAFEAIYAKFSEAYRKSDPKMVADLYTKDAFYLQPGSRIERGYEFVFKTFSFLNQYKTRPKGGPAIGFRIVDRNVSGDIAWDIGYYVMNAEGNAITSQDEPNGKFIVLWKQGADGQWRIFADGYSDVRPPQPPPSAERVSAEKAVVRAVNAYIEGVMNNDSVQLDIAFHPDAELSATLPDGRIYRSPYSEWRKFTTRPKGDPAGKTNRIARVDINGNAAVAVTVLDWPRVRYVDYLSLIKTGADDWKIVSKVWNQEAKQTPAN
jgi:uncharacterized protein (TIGR02246 family)